MSPTVQDASWPIPGLISCTVVNSVMWRWEPMIFGTLGPHNYEDLGTLSQNLHRYCDPHPHIYDVMIWGPLHRFVPIGVRVVTIFDLLISIDSRVLKSMLGSPNSCRFRDGGPHIYGIPKSMTPGDEDWYLMHRMQSYDWPYSKVGRDSSKALSLHAAVLHAAVFLLQLFGLSLWGLWKMQVLWDKPKYSGPGKKKQCCVKQCCLAMKADILSPPSPKRKEQGR